MHVLPAAVTAIVVFGFAEGGTILRDRAVRAGEIYKAIVAERGEGSCVLIASGGVQAFDTGRRECEDIRSHLHTMGISDVLCESRSSDTITNIANTLRILRDMSVFRPPGGESWAPGQPLGHVCSVVFVSSQSHLARVSAICEALQLSEVLAWSLEGVLHGDRKSVV